MLAVGVVVIAVEIALILAAVLVAVHRLARAADSLEVLAYRVESEVEGIGQTLRSGWMSSLQTALGLIGGFFAGREKRR